ncbi:MAG: hypothetical protein ACYTG0_12545 [Planctomycetota bacterium]|jgi:hypothetical protein
MEDRTLTLRQLWEALYWAVARSDDPVWGGWEVGVPENVCQALYEAIASVPALDNAQDMDDRRCASLHVKPPEEGAVRNTVYAYATASNIELAAWMRQFRRNMDGWECEFNHPDCGCTTIRGMSGAAPCSQRVDEEIRRRASCPQAAVLKKGG